MKLEMNNIERGDLVSLDSIHKELAADSRIVAVHVHGSVAKGTPRNDSDLDIAALCYPGVMLTSMDLLLLTEKLASLSKREIHLSVLSHDNLIFLREVIEHGELLFSKDSFYSDLFVCTGLSLAAKLHEDSWEVINAYTA